MPDTMNQGRFIFQDEADAIAYWRDKEWKIFAVRITAGPAKRPTYKRTEYARARTAEAAIACVQRNMLTKPPRGARYAAHLAGPRELGCVPTPGVAQP